MTIEYRTDASITVDQFLDVLERSTLAERRPVEDRECIEGMLRGADLMVSAWDGKRLVGVARSVTDFCYACYLSDLAVDAAYQRSGIGKALIAQTLEQLGPRCKLRLLSAPAAAEYYPRIGFVHNPNCWELAPGMPFASAATSDDPAEGPRTGADSVGAAQARSASTGHGEEQEG